MSLGCRASLQRPPTSAGQQPGCAGHPINAEDAFGLDKSGFRSPKFKPWCASARRHRLQFDYFSWIAPGTTTHYRTHRIPRCGAAARRSRGFRPVAFARFGISYEYSFLHSEKYEVAATIGINDTDISARRAGSRLQTRHVDQTEDQAGPFPTVGIGRDLCRQQAFYFDGRAQYMKVRVDHLDGSLGIYEADALYRLRPNISFALGYSMLRGQPRSRRRPRQAGLFQFQFEGSGIFRQDRLSRQSRRAAGAGAGCGMAGCGVARSTENSTRLFAAAALFQSARREDCRLRAG